MNAYTITAPEMALEGLKAGLETIAARTKDLSLAARTALMLVCGPLIGLAFVIALPLASLTLIAYYGARLIAARWAGILRHVKNVALFLAAPFIGLAYLLAFPFVGIGALVYMGVKAARHR